MLDNARLERLAHAFHDRGIPVRENLLPGATADELAAVEDELGVTLPPDYRTLYSWSSGCRDTGSGPRLLFRDMSFLPLSEVVECRRTMVETYRDYDSDQSTVGLYGVDLGATAPFAEYMGSFLAVACGEQRLAEGNSHPVVNAFQGVELFFHSIETMVETCIEWVEQPDYQELGPAPNEMEIWLRLNPCLFS